MILLYTYFALNLSLVMFFYKIADEELKQAEKDDDEVTPRAVTYLILFLFGFIILLLALIVKIFYFIKKYYDKFRL